MTNNNANANSGGFGGIPSPPTGQQAAPASNMQASISAPPLVDQSSQQGMQSQQPHQMMNQGGQMYPPQQQTMMMMNQGGQMPMGQPPGGQYPMQPQMQQPQQPQQTNGQPLSPKGNPFDIY